MLITLFCRSPSQSSMQYVLIALLFRSHAEIIQSLWILFFPPQYFEPLLLDTPRRRRSRNNSRHLPFARRLKYLLGLNFALRKGHIKHIGDLHIYDSCLGGLTFLGVCSVKWSVFFTELVQFPKMIFSSCFSLVVQVIPFPPKCIPAFIYATTYYKLIHMYNMFEKNITDFFLLLF